MCDRIFKIVFEKPTILGPKTTTIIAKNNEINVFMDMCRKHNYHIINVEHV